MRDFIKILTLFSVIGLLASCASKSSDMTPEMKQAAVEKELIKKKAELDKLKFEVQDLEKQLLSFDPEYKKREEEKKWRLVSVREVNKKSFDQKINFQGTIQTKGDFKVSSEQGGLLKMMEIKEGQRVEAGQLVGKTDNSIFLRNMDELKTGLVLARDVLRRRQNLWNKQIGSEMELIKAKNDVESLERKMATLQAQMDKVNIYSPNSGVVDKVIIKEGEIAPPGQPIFTLLNTANVQVVADIPEQYLLKVKRGQKVAVKIPALEMEQTGRISKIGEMINPNNRTFQVEISISSRGGRVKPNLMAEVEIKESSKKGAMVLPTNLIQNEMDGDYVFVVKNKDKKKIAEKVKIETGTTNNGETLIVSGLEGDELVIEDGARGVTDGEFVKLVK